MTKLQKIKKKWPSLVREAGPWYLAFLFNITLAGALFNLVENVNVFQAIWFGLVTGSTTGFGDVLPDTVWGYLIAVYIILSSAILDTMWRSKFIVVMIEEPNLYSHAEQEREEAKSDLMFEMLSENLRRFYGLKPEDFPSWKRYDDALKVVAEEEEAK